VSVICRWWRIAGATGDRAQPTVLVRSPYGRRGLVGVIFGRLLAERGFQVVIQSARGTFGSGGQFSPFDERADGLATYTTPPLSGALEALGPVRVELWVRASGCAPQARRPNSRQYGAVGAVTSGSAALPGSLSSAAVIGFGA
jgi:predicted acyl esterase